MWLPDVYTSLDGCGIFRRHSQALRGNNILFFKENDKLVAACEQAGSKLNEIMQSDDAQAIKGQLSKLLSSINQSEK